MYDAPGTSVEGYWTILPGSVASFRKNTTRRGGSCILAGIIDLCALVAYVVRHLISCRIFTYPPREFDCSILEN